MDTAKVYHDIDGNDCTIHQMVSREPSWAAVRIQEGEKAIQKVVEQAQRIEELESYIRVAYLEGGCVDYRDNLDKCWNESDAKEFINTQDT